MEFQDKKRYDNDINIQNQKYGNRERNSIDEKNIFKQEQTSDNICNTDNLQKIDTNENSKFNISKWMKISRGFIVSSIHGLIIFYLIIVSIFSFNVKLLLFSLMVNFGLIIINILVHNCPLTIMEEEIWGDSIVNWFNRNMPINYGCKRQFEVQLQYLFVSSGIITLKILFYLVKNDMVHYLNIQYT